MRVPVLIISLLLFIKNECPTEWLCQRTFMKGYWAIQILAITNDIAVYVTLWVFMWILILYFSNINIWSGTVVLYSKYTFNFMKSDESLFSNEYAVLLSHHQDGSIPVAPHACQPMMRSVRLALLATSPLVLLDISLVTYSSEHLCWLFCLVMHILKGFYQFKNCGHFCFQGFFFLNVVSEI